MDGIQCRPCTERFTNRALILEPHNQTNVISIFNAPVPVDITFEDIAASPNDIYSRQTHAFKINMTFGMILRHIETSEYRYFRPFSNQAIFLSSDIYREAERYIRYH